MRIEGAEAMKAYASTLIEGLSHYADRASVVALSGDLGAGKTTLTQGIASALGVSESVVSPTFVIEKSYDLINQRWQKLIHIDAYRLINEHELEVLGWHDILADGTNLIIIEWPEMVAGLIPSHAVRVELSGTGEVREVVVHVPAV